MEIGHTFYSWSTFIVMEAGFLLYVLSSACISWYIFSTLFTIFWPIKSTLCSVFYSSNIDCILYNVWFLQLSHIVHRCCCNMACFLLTNWMYGLLFKDYEGIKVLWRRVGQKDQMILIGLVWMKFSADPRNWDSKEICEVVLKWNIP